MSGRSQVGYPFLGLLAFTVDFAGRLEATFILLFRVSTAAIRVSALSISAAWRALCVALRWLARRFISFALWAPRIASSIDGWCVLRPSALSTLKV
jgi:hypothetical protein